MAEHAQNGRRHGAENPATPRPAASSPGSFFDMTLHRINSDFQDSEQMRLLGRLGARSEAGSTYPYAECLSIATMSQSEQSGPSETCFPNVYEQVQFDTPIPSNLSSNEYLALESTSPTPSLSRMPSLTESNDSDPLRTPADTVDESEVHTDISAKHLAGHQVLESGPDGELLATESVKTYKCIFFFLRCDECFDSKAEWETHCEAHLKRNVPPKHAFCTLCNTKESDGAPKELWAWRLEHAAMHMERGDDITAGKPDHDLFRYLWGKRIIPDQDLKDLQQYHDLRSAPEAYRVTERTRRGVGSSRRG